MQKIVHRALKRKGRNDYFLLSAIFISSSGLTTGVLCLETNILDQHFNHVGALIVPLKLSLGSFSASLVPAIWLQPPPWARDYAQRESPACRIRRLPVSQSWHAANPTLLT